MSLRNKLLAAAEAGAQEATAVERGRCLWCAEQVVLELKAKLGKKLLGSAESHSAEVKFKIAQAVVSELRRAIVSGIRPPGGQGTPAAADLPPPRIDHGDEEESDGD